MASEKASQATLLEHFQDLEDPRVCHLIEHRLLDIIGLTICAVLCGADSWVEIELYGKAKREWLKSFLALPSGIPLPRHHCPIICRLKSRSAASMFFRLGENHCPHQ
jgi:hypothetical protein